MTSSTDFTTLGRLGTAGSGAPPRRRPPRRRQKPVSRTPAPLGVAGRVLQPRVLLGTVLGVVALLFVIGLWAGSQTAALPSVAQATPEMDPVLEATLRAGGTQMVATGAIALTPGGGADAAAVAAPQAFAAVDDIALHLPLPQTQGVIFLEADSAEALPLVPVGTMAHNGNPVGFQPGEDMAGPEYTVAAPRSGTRPATGMAAFLTAPGATLLAPVQGVVTTVSQYTTADGVQDWKITLQPTGRSDLQVVLRNIETPLVTPGQDITVGLTELGTVRSGSAVDAELNPLSLPSALMHVRPATEEEGTVVLPGVPATTPGD